MVQRHALESSMPGGEGKAPDFYYLLFQWAEHDTVYHDTVRASGADDTGSSMLRGSNMLWEAIC
jgi:hypothetical protein